LLIVSLVAQIHAQSMDRSSITVHNYDFESLIDHFLTESHSTQLILDTAQN